jgi:SAM-dependent methyltransferase
MNYFLPEGYVARLGAKQDPAREAEILDKYQDEVYRRASLLYPRCVLDYGTGSGFKLVKYFDKAHPGTVIGVDLRDTVTLLRRKYPDRMWTTPEYLPPPSTCDLIICADVIEHVDDPDTLLMTLKSLEPQLIIISTPDRDLIAGAAPLGPPLNPAHVREWNFVEFREYLDSHFNVHAHFYSSKAQATQCAIVRLKA